MKILVTGAKGFIGKNLCLFLREKGEETIEYDIDSPKSVLTDGIKECDAIIHLAGVNRPKDEKEFNENNVDFLTEVLNLIKRAGRKIPFLLSSSTQALKDNPYGKSKKVAEDLVFSFAKETGNPVYVYRVANAFGKWCRPNYNSVIATFCYNVAHNLDINVNEEAGPIEFVYIDDIVRCFYESIKSGLGSADILSVIPSYHSTPKQIASLLKGFKNSRKNLLIPLEEEFVKKLYATYLTYLSEDDFAYELNPHIDDRGSFTEVFKTYSFGQVSINISKPGIAKGNHYHHTKNEKFVVLKGTCLIEFRKVGEDKIISYKCSGDKLQVVDIPPGYTHRITNIGEEDSYTLMWASERFDPERSDTIYLEV